MAKACHTRGAGGARLPASDTVEGASRHTMYEPAPRKLPLGVRCAGAEKFVAVGAVADITVSGRSRAA